jgi:hypothetical protein
MYAQPVPYIQDFEGDGLDIESPVPGVPRDVLRKPYHTAGEARIVQPARAVASAAAGTVSNFPAHLYPPRNAFMLDLPLNRIPFILGAGVSLAFSVWPRVPQGQVGVVRKLAVVLTAGLLGNLRVTTRVNGAPVQPFPGVVGAVGTLEAPQEILVALAAGDVFDVLCTETGGVGVTVAVRSVGWFYSEERR